MSESRALAPADLARWFTHHAGCDVSSAYVFMHNDGNPGVACDACRRRVALRGDTRWRAIALRALRLAQHRAEQSAHVGPPRYVVQCIDCGRDIARHRADRAAVPICADCSARRDARKAGRRRNQAEKDGRTR